MKLQYSTELEELAYSKDADALFKAADHVIQPQDLTVERRDAAFFEAGLKLHYHALGPLSSQVQAHWFTWHGDDRTALIFTGVYGDVNRKIRKLCERAERA